MEIGGAPGSSNLAGSPNGAVTQVNVNAGSGGVPQLLTARNSRLRFKVQNQDPTITIFFGFTNAVTTGNGFRVDPKSESDWVDFSGTVYAIADAAGPADVRVMELYS
jgi:hypothetical protein